MKYKGYIVTAFLLALSACNKEDYHYPDVITDLVELETDSSSNIHLIRTDDGVLYSPDKTIAFKDSTPDSLYRVRCTYLPINEGGGKATLYNVHSVISPFPKGPDFFKEGIKTDPVKITSIWKSGGYINLHLGVLTKGRAHKYHFLNLGKSRNSMGKATQRIQLFHSQEEDPEAYWEMRIGKSELTDELCLYVEDFALPEDIDDLHDLWDDNMERLHQASGI